MVCTTFGLNVRNTSLVFSLFWRKRSLKPSLGDILILTVRMPRSDYFCEASLFEFIRWVDSYFAVFADTSYLCVVTSLPALEAPTHRSSFEITSKQKFQEFSAFWKSPFYSKLSEFLSGALYSSWNFLENGVYVKYILQKTPEFFGTLGRSFLELSQPPRFA